jgi:GT2 family glycosyltransferase
VVANELVDREQIGPPARVLDPGHNLGFAGGVALAAQEAAGDWIALVNDDCTVDSDALAQLLAAGESAPDVGSVAAQVVFATRPDIVNSAGLEIDELGIAYERLLGSPAKSGGEPTEVFGASATAALYRRAMLDELGGFDTSFFAYLEDADLAWRARMGGWRCLHVPRAVAYHRHSATLGHASRRKDFLVGRNRVRMLAKNAAGSQLRRRGVAIVAYDLAQVAFAALRRGTGSPARGRLAGLKDWRAYRRAGASRRRPVRLAPPQGLRAALHRDRVYRTISGSTAEPGGSGGPASDSRA